MRAAVVLVLAIGCGRVNFGDHVDARAADASADQATDVTDSTVGPAVIQQAGNSATAVSTLSAMLGAPVGAGDVVLLVGGGSIGPLQVPVGGAISWNRAAYSIANANVEIWYGTGAGASTTVTIQASGTTDMSMWVAEWSGLDASIPLDQAMAASGVTSPATAGSIDTTNARDLVIFGVRDFVPNTFGAPTGGTWMLLDTRTSSTDQAVWSELLDQTATVAPTVSETRNMWDAALAAFRVNP